jgi:5-methyltetrahydropteroyltriglutamate--homocysteine methyltransferase
MAEGIRTTVVGSWPPDEAYQDRLRLYHRGALSSNEAEMLLHEVAAQAIAQQKACGLDEYTGGETWADSFILHFPRWLTGITPTGDHQAWEGRGTYRVIGPLGAPKGLGLAAAFRREKAIDPLIRKVTIPGPSEIVMMIEPQAERVKLWPAVIEITRQEIREFVAAGAGDVQLDAPHIAMGLADGDWQPQQAVDVISRIFEGITGVRRSVHFCYGDFGAQTWTRNRHFHALLPTIQALDGVIDRVVLEFSLPEQWAERVLLREIPDSIEIAAGIVDVKNPRIETADEIGARIGELISYVPAQRLLICPSCGLGRRNTAMAIGKTTAMVQAARAVNGADSHSAWRQ